MKSHTVTPQLQLSDSAVRLRLADSDWLTVMLVFVSYSSTHGIEIPRTPSVGPPQLMFVAVLETQE